jgi:hypothetical protein
LAKPKQPAFFPPSRQQRLEQGAIHDALPQPRAPATDPMSDDPLPNAFLGNTSGRGAFARCQFLALGLQQSRVEDVLSNNSWHLQSS